VGASRTNDVEPSHAAGRAKQIGLGHRAVAKERSYGLNVTVLDRRAKRVVREAAADGLDGLLAQVGRAERVLLEQHANDHLVVGVDRVAERGRVALEQDLGVRARVGEPRFDALNVAAVNRLDQLAVLRRLGRRQAVRVDQHGRSQHLNSHRRQVNGHTRRACSLLLSRRGRTPSHGVEAQTALALEQRTFEVGESESEIRYY